MLSRLRTRISTQRTLLGAVALSSITLGACSNGDSTGPIAGNRFSLGFQIAQSTGSSSMMSSSSARDAAANGGVQLVGGGASAVATPGGLKISRASDTIMVTKAQFVVSDVRLRSVTGECAESVAAAAANDKKNDYSECPEIKLGPFLVNVPVTGEDGARISVDVPAGIYGNIRMKLHKVDANNALDLPFQQENPDFRNITVRLEGTYNGVPFTFVTDVSTTLNVPLTKPLVVKEGGDEVTISVDVASWFVNTSGGLYSPAAANTPGSIRGAVISNIERAFRAFRDRNHDGRED